MRQKDTINRRTQLWLKFFTSSLLITTLVYLYVAFKLFSRTLDANSIETLQYFYQQIQHKMLMINTRNGKSDWKPWQKKQWEQIIR